MNSTTTDQAGQQTAAVRPSTNPRPNGSLGRVTTVSLAAGLMCALLLTVVVFSGAGEPVITGAGLIGLSIGWALLGVLSRWRTDRPQWWAAVPATVMATAGVALLVLRPGDAAMNAAGWAWAPVMLALAVWSAVQARRSLATKARTWLVMPALALLAVVSVGGGYQTLRVTLDSAVFPMPGRSVDVGGYSLHLDCAGKGGPTVILESGLGGSSTQWTRITDQVSETTRVCSYDRAGQGWSESADGPRDGHAIAAELAALLDAAGEAGPYVVVGHSVGGPYAMTFAAENTAAVAGVVLLDATDPYRVDVSAAGMAGGANGPMALLPSLARMGLAHLYPASSNLPSPAAEANQAYTTSARAMTNAVDEVSQYGAAFAQAQELTTLGSRPLVVVTLTEKAAGDPAGYAAQERFAALSTNSSLWTADVTHDGLVEDRHGAAASAQAIADVVQAIRTGSEVPRR